MIQIITALTPDHFRCVRYLFLQYSASLPFDLEFQGFQKEVAAIPGGYSAPDGCILLARYLEQFVGCVALRRIGTAVCEMKRLYVTAEFRQRRIGRMLAQAVIASARRMGYQRMRLDTVESMKAANALYRSLGFYPVAAYYNNPLDGARYYELLLKENVPDQI